jgi:hypothetical protein
VNDASALKHDRRLVRIVRRVEHDDFVTRPHHGGDGVENRFRRATRDGDFAFGIQPRAVRGFDVACDRLAQPRHARHRGVLILSTPGVTSERFEQRLGRIVVGKSLPEVHGAVLLGQARHHRENGGAHLGELGKT